MKQKLILAVLALLAICYSIHTGNAGECLLAMALVQYGNGVAMMSGRQAGTVFSHNKGGSYTRRFSVPVNAATTFQQNVRSSLADNSSGWRQLMDADRAAWVAWASTHPVINRLGAAIILSGQQAYVQMNRNAFSSGEAANFFTVPPPEPVYEFPFAADFGIDADGTGGALTIESTVQPSADTIVQIFASPPLSPGRTFAKDLSKFIGIFTVLAATVPPTDNDILALWVGRFGTFGADLVGKKLIIAVRSYSNGQWSGITSSSTIVV